MVATNKDKKQMRRTSKAASAARAADDTASEKETPADSETAADSEGLSPEQEDALNKIMAEIEGNGATDAEEIGDQPDADAAAGAGAGAGAGTDTDAAANGGVDAVADAAAGADTDGEDEAKRPPSAEGAPRASDDADDADEGLSPEQEDALEKIMAEIEGNGATEAEESGAQPDADAAAGAGAGAGAGTDTDAVAAAAADGGDEAKQPPSDEVIPSASDDDADADDGLSPEQEDALNKILAEIEGYEEAPASEAPASNAAASDAAAPDAAASDVSDAAVADGSSSDEAVDGEDAKEPALDESALDDEADSEAGLNSDQEDALNKIMAEIEGQSSSPPTEASPSQDSESVATVADSESPSSDGQAPGPAASPADLSEETADGALPSTEDLLSQIQAAAQGSEEELTVSPTSTDGFQDSAPAPEAAPPKETGSEKATAAPKPTASADAPPPPLAELEDPAPSKKGSASKPRRTLSKKMVKTAVWTGLAAAVVVLMATGTYYWLSRGDTAPTAPPPPAAVEITSEAAPADAPLKEDILENEDLANGGQANGSLTQTSNTTTAPPHAPERSPESERLEALSERIQTHRADMLAKAREVEDLSAYYADGIEKVTQELVARIKERQVTDFKSAQKDTAISMGLETIQRRSGYIEKLVLPHKQILAAAEELRYLARKADILSMIAAKSSGLNLDPFSKQVDEVLERLSRDVSALTLEETASAGSSLKEIWENVWAAHMKAPKKEPPATVAMRRNTKIWKEICGGDFKRVGELSALSGDAATCLAAWEGKDLFLNNLEQLSPEAAQGLSTWKGEWLVLNGLKSLSPEAAGHLAAWKGKRLSLNGLTSLSPAATRALAKWQGRQIEMIGLRRLAAWDNTQVTLYVRSEVRDNLTP